MPDEVYLYCPKCKEEVLLTANMYNVSKASASVLDYGDHCEIDYGGMEIEGDFEYICEYCGTKLAADMEDVEKKLKEKESGRIENKV